jgi:hypothetical protein
MGAFKLARIARQVVMRAPLTRGSELRTELVLLSA